VEIFHKRWELMSLLILLYYLPQSSCYYKRYSRYRSKNWSRLRISLCPLLVILLHNLHQECGQLHSHSVRTATRIKDSTLLIAQFTARHPLYFPPFTQTRLGPTLQVCVSFRGSFVCLFIWVPLKIPSWQKTNNSITDNMLNFPYRQPRSFKTSIKS
jgi:hypothetical protein